MTINTVTTTITDISLAKLIPCPANVRRTGAGSGIDALAASIQAHGLLQSLVVRPKLDSEGQASDRYEVVAGGRRLAALKLLAKQKRITKGTAIPCRVLDTDGVDGIEASLAENIVRQDMHPADQFEAFHGLHQGGIGIEDIAARFGVSAHTVRQRLRLASVSPALIHAYRNEDLTLDDLTAFAVTEDQEAQERVFGQLQTWQRNPDTIRRLLTHALIPATDRKALFVGLDAYTAAGGIVQRDLFSEDRGGWITDAALLERLVAERMEREAEAIRAEGWRWVGIGQEAQAAAWNLRRVWPDKVELSSEDDARRRELAARHDEIAEQHNGSGDDLPDDIAAELDRIEAELAELEAREEAWQPEDVAIGGVILTIAVDGSLRIDRGYVRAEDEPRSRSRLTRTTRHGKARRRRTDGRGGERQHGDAFPSRAGAGGQGPCPVCHLAGRVRGAPDRGVAGRACLAARACLAGDGACPGDGRALQPLWRDCGGLAHLPPLPSPLPAPALPTARRGRPCARPRTHGAPGCPASTEHFGHGCRTRTCRPC